MRVSGVDLVASGKGSGTIACAERVGQKQKKNPKVHTGCDHNRLKLQHIYMRSYGYMKIQKEAMHVIHFQTAT